MSLLARGDVLSFVMADGRTVKLPKHFILLHDPDGKLIDMCTLVCCACDFDTHERHTIPTRIRQHAADYFGYDTPLVTGTVELPEGPWQRLGVVDEILYDRHGHYEDSFYHPYHPDADTSVELFRQGRGKAYLLVLPEGCVIDARGFVKP